MPPASKSTRKTEAVVKTTTMIGVAATCLVVGFFGGVIFSILRQGTPAIGQPSVQQPVGTVDRSRELDALTRETVQNPENKSAWIELGNVYFDTAAHDKAIWAYNKALALDPNNANVWTDLGVMYRRSGKPEKAVEAFDRAIQVDPKHEISRFNKGIVLLHDLNDRPGAIRAWEELLAINPVAMGPGGKSVDEMVIGIKQSPGSSP